MANLWSTEASILFGKNNRKQKVSLERSKVELPEELKIIKLMLYI